MKYTHLGISRKDTIAFAFSLLLLTFSSLAKANEPTGPTDCDLLAAHPRDSSKVVSGVEWEDMEMKKAVWACNKALKEYPGSPRLMYQYGRALHRGEFYGIALKWYRKAADKGYVFAMLRLGIIYDEGQIGEKDVAQALKWYRKAADKGDAESKTIVAKLESEVAAKAKAENAVVQQQTLAASNRAIENDAVYILKARLGMPCEVLENTRIVENIKRTAGKLNHPAYIIGINYDCHNSKSGIQNLTIYVGFVINPNFSGYQCTTNGRSSSAVIESMAWIGCGGLNSRPL